VGFGETTTTPHIGTTTTTTEKMVTVAHMVDVDLLYHHSISCQKTILMVDSVTTQVIPTTTIVGLAMVSI